MKAINSLMLRGVPGVLSFSFMTALSGCGGGDSSGNSGSSTQSYSLSATVSGLTGSGLVLSVDSEQVSVSSGATSVTLASGLPSGSTYSVAVTTQPTNETCSIANGTGTLVGGNVTKLP
jgi:hypothetical protein